MIFETDPPHGGHVVVSRGPAPPAGMRAFSDVSKSIAADVNAVIHGKPEVIHLALVCLLAEGHLLLEDVPGVGKTSLARALAEAMGGQWQRIQFTPDLLPGDVTGVSVFHQDVSQFVFHPGPVFANVVLADEINRASPRTQSALLEVMEERTVTVDGRPNQVPRPFMVIATQNPIDMVGTYPLPEAQLDRFLLRTTVGYPGHEAEVRVLETYQSGSPTAAGAPAATAEEVRTAIRYCRDIHVAAPVLDYIVSIVERTREIPELTLGASPRGAIGLLRAARVAAALDGREYVVPSDVSALASPVLGHRIVLAPAFTSTGGTADDVVNSVLSAVTAPLAEDG